jgi:hypothetical protein
MNKKTANKLLFKEKELEAFAHAEWVNAREQKKEAINNRWSLIKLEDIDVEDIISGEISLLHKCIAWEHEANRLCGPYVVGVDESLKLSAIRQYAMFEDLINKIDNMVYTIPRMNMDGRPIYGHEGIPCVTVQRARNIRAYYNQVVGQ